MHQEMLQHIHAEQINEAKLQFFINISHEIRTPMSLIISPLQKLIKNEENNERLKIYHIIYRNAERILNLVNQLMDIRKIDKGQMFLMFRETNIIPFIMYNFRSTGKYKEYPATTSQYAPGTECMGRHR